MATTTNLDSLVINYLTQEQYDEAQQAGTLNANQLYLTPDTGPAASGTVTSITAGNGLSGGTISTSGTISHADTSSQASSSNSGRTYIQSLTLDTYGHVTGISTATETVTNTDEKVKATALTFDDNEYYPIFGDSSGIAKTKNYTTAFGIGCSSTYNRIDLKLGTASIAGQITLYRGQDSNRYATIKINTITGGRIITIPDKTGTIALTSDIPKVYSSTNTNGYLTMSTLPIYDGTVV